MTGGLELAQPAHELRKGGTMKTKGTENLLVLLLVLLVLAAAIIVGPAMIQDLMDETGGTRIIHVLDCADGSCPTQAPHPVD